METSYSAISNFNSCPKKFYYSNKLRLSPKRKETSTATGRAIHEAFDLYVGGKSHKDCLMFIKKTFDDALSSTLDPYDHESLTINKWIALGMWEFYPITNIKFDKFYPEQHFKVPINKEVNLVGYLDGLVVNNNQIWVREVKTTGLNLFQAKGRADVSYQASGYIWAMQKILKKRVHGVYFDIIRKPLTRKGQSEDASSFGERNYKLYRDPKNHKNLYTRHFSYRSEYQIKEFEKDLLMTADDIVRAERKGAYRRWPGSCYMYGRECPFKKICWHEDVDADMLEAFYDRRPSRKPNGTTLTMEDNSLEEA